MPSGRVGRVGVGSGRGSAFRASLDGLQVVPETVVDVCVAGRRCGWRRRRCAREAAPTVGVAADALDLFGRGTAELGRRLLQLGFRDQFRAAAGALERATVVRAPHHTAPPPPSAVRALTSSRMLTADLPLLERDALEKPGTTVVLQHTRTGTRAHGTCGYPLCRVH